MHIMLPACEMTLLIYQFSIIFIVLILRSGTIKFCEQTICLLKYLLEKINNQELEDS